MDPHFCKMQWRSPDKLRKTRMSPNANQIVSCITFIQHNATLSNSYQKYVNWLCVYLTGHHSASLWADCPVGKSTLDLACTAVRGAQTHPETSLGSHGASTTCELCQAECRWAGGQSSQQPVTSPRSPGKHTSEMASNSSGVAAVPVLTSRCGISGCLSKVTVTMRVTIPIQNQNIHTLFMNGRVIFILPKDIVS